jgi:NAD(P)-dependent dehydrogenase (short-subunit alcohol dehydrogenase family)
MNIPRNVLVVAASRGIGLELAAQYRAEGARVVATARDDAGLARVAGLGARALRLDVNDAASAAGLAWQIDGEAFDAVFVCPGVAGPRTSGLTPPAAADFDAVMHTNVLGPMRVLSVIAQALAPGARIGVLSSRMGSMALRTNASLWTYRASKAALNSVVRDAALVLAGRALCVALHPGWVRTDLGGSGADIDVATSAAGLRRTLATLTTAQHGAFLDVDGTPIAW